jgi:hypothetical protein
LTTIDIDGLSEEEFRRSIESRLRQGLADKAADKLRQLLAPFAGPGGVLPERFLTVTAKDLAFNGWDALEDSIRRHDLPGRPITALSIAFGWPGEEVPQPDDQGNLSPLIEIGYFTDDAFPFSQSSREDLLDGYSYHGCTWAGDCEATDTSLWLTGIDDLHGALALLEARLLASEEPDEEGIRAGSLGACLLSVLLFQAVTSRIAQGELTRPLCVMAGSNGVYPYFDAPVAGFPEEVRRAAELAEEDETLLASGVPAPRYSSLLVTGIPRARKRAVLVLEESADEAALRLGKLRGLTGDGGSAETELEPPVPAISEVTIAAVPASPLLVKKSSGQAWDFREMLSPYAPDSGAPGAAPLELDQDWAGEETLEPETNWDGGEPFEPKPDFGAAEPFAPDHDLGGNEPPELELEQEWGGDEPHDPEPDFGAGVPLEPASEPLPALLDSGEAAVGPGFSLIDSLREERHQPIFPLPMFHIEEEAKPAPEAEPEFEPAAPAAAEPEPLSFAEPELEAVPDWAPPAAVEPKPDPFAAAEPPAPVWPLGPGWLQDAEARILPKAKPEGPAFTASAGPAPYETKGLWERLRDWWQGRS